MLIFIGLLISVASVEVQDVFIVYRQTLLDFMGLSLPAALPDPGDLAMLTQIDQALGALNGQASGGQQQQLPQAAGAQQ